MGIKAVISLQKASRTYRQGETILGTFEVETGNQEVTHEGITLFLDGHIALLRPKMRLAIAFFHIQKSSLLALLSCQCARKPLRALFSCAYDGQTQSQAEMHILSYTY